jgi:hypothetical protein
MATITTVGGRVRSCKCDNGESERAGHDTGRCSARQASCPETRQQWVPSSDPWRLDGGRENLVCGHADRYGPHVGLVVQAAKTELPTLWARKTWFEPHVGLLDFRLLQFGFGLIIIFSLDGLRQSQREIRRHRAAHVPTQTARPSRGLQVLGGLRLAFPLFDSSNPSASTLHFPRCPVHS